MASLTNTHFVQSPPMRVEWAGFQSDTYTMQRCGWEISISDNEYNLAITLAVRHKESGLYGLSRQVDKTCIANFIRHSSLTSIVFIIDRLAYDIRYSGEVETIREYFSSFVPVDATPRIVEMDFQDVSIRDFKIFHEVNIDAKEVYLRHASLEEVLELALQKQAPMQDRIRRKMLEDERLKRASSCRAELRLIA